MALSSCDYDIVVVWLNAKILNSELTDEYTIYRCDRSPARSQHERGGGVLIGVRRHLQCNTVQIDNTDQLEQVVVRVVEGNRALFLCTVYLPPNTDPTDYQRHVTCVSNICNQMNDHDKIIVIGDYNLPRLHWDFDDDIGCFIPTNASSEQETSLVETILASGLLQINHLMKNNGTLLNLVFVNDPENCEIFEPPSPLLKVDDHHKPFAIKHAVQQTTTTNQEEEYYYDFRTCDFEELNRTFSTINWTEILMTESIDEAVSKFYLELDTVIHLNVPLRKRVIRADNKQPWWNRELRNLRNRSRKARKRYFRTRDDDQKAVVRELERQFNSLNQACFRSYVSRVESDCKGNPQQLWRYIRQRTSTHEIPRNVFYRSTTAASPIESASLFSCFFQSVSSNNSPPLNEQYLNNLQMYNLNIPLLCCQSSIWHCSLLDQPFAGNSISLESGQARFSSVWWIYLVRIV
nr:uncharacterized protein LOC115262289 [Aedes albopictus]